MAGTAAIANAAAQAGAGGVASMAAAPFPLDLTAPAFGASMAAAALSFGTLKTASGGDVQVKPGMYELHKDEMVLPEWAATPLRQSLLGGGTPSFGAPANDTGGNVHINISALDGHSVKRMIMTEKHTIAKAVNEAVRSGYQQARR